MTQLGVQTRQASSRTRRPINLPQVCAKPSAFLDVARWRLSNEPLRGLTCCAASRSSAGVEHSHASADGVLGGFEFVTHEPHSSGRLATHRGVVGSVTRRRQRGEAARILERLKCVPQVIRRHSWLEFQEGSAGDQTLRRLLRRRVEGVPPLSNCQWLGSASHRSGARSRFSSSHDQDDVLKSKVAPATSKSSRRSCRASARSASRSSCAIFIPRRVRHASANRPRAKVPTAPIAVSAIVQLLIVDPLWRTRTASAALGLKQCDD